VHGQLQRVFEALHGAGVEYLVVGGVAVVLHGHLRVTADLDLVVRLTHDNVRGAIDSLARIGLQPRLPVPLQISRMRRHERRGCRNVG
jgi:hypothetical protein